MKSFMFSLVAVASIVVSSNLFAQSCGSGCLSGGCNVNTRTNSQQAVPPEVDPLPTSLTKIDKTEVRGFRAPDVVAQRPAREADFGSGPQVTFASNRRTVEVQPASGLNLGLVNVNRQTAAPAASPQTENQVIRLGYEIDRLKEDVADARANGVSEAEIARMVDQRVASNPLLQPDYDRITAEVVSRVIASPQFAEAIGKALTASKPNAGDFVGFEVVEVE